MTPKEKRYAIILGWRRRHKEKVSEYFKQFYHSEVGKAYRQRKKKTINANNAKYRKTPRGRLAQIAKAKRMRLKYPEKYSARDKARYAVKTGKLKKKPCEVCKTTENIHGHHEDYSKPLDVNWLCAKHHRAKHGYTC